MSDRTTTFLHPELARVFIPHGSGLCLDLGCGDGNTRMLVEQSGYTWIGADIAANRNLSVVCDAHYLPFRDAAFSAVVAVAVWEHFWNPWQALCEVRRILKDNGYTFGSVAFLEPYHDSYFHFSHLGLRTILEGNGFSIEHLSVGWNGVEAIANTLYGRPLRPLFHLVAAFTMRIRRLLIGLLLNWFLARGDKRQYLRKQGYLENDDLRFAGSLIFLARRTGEGSNC